MKKITHVLGLMVATAFVVFGTTSNILAEPDWSQIEPQTVTIFYPGLTSWQILQSEDHGKGAKSVKKNKKSCAKCHISKKGEFDMAADEIIAGTLTRAETGAAFETKPREGSGFMDIKVQAAYDAENIYINVHWPSAGTSFNDASVAEKGMADRVSVQLAGDKDKQFKNYGCYVTCHSDLKDMQEDAGKKLYADMSMRKGKPLAQDKMAMYIEKGRFIDQWVGAFHGSEIKTTDEFILGERTADNNDVTAAGSYADGNYNLTFTRALTTGDRGDIAINDGDMVYISIAIHEKNANSRFHYTSFPIALGLGAKKADVSAVKL